MNNPTQQLLTNEEIMAINQTAEFDSAIGYARAIEAKVLEKLNCLDPVGYYDPQEMRFWWAIPTKIDAPVSVKVAPLPLYALEKK